MSETDLFNYSGYDLVDEQSFSAGSFVRQNYVKYQNYIEYQNQNADGSPTVSKKRKIFHRNYASSSSSSASYSSYGPPPHTADGNDNSKTEKFSAERDIKSESFITVGNSRWRISWQIREDSSDKRSFYTWEWLYIQLVEFSWTEALNYAFETVLVMRQCDNYVEHVVEKKRETVANQMVEQMPLENKWTTIRSYCRENGMYYDNKFSNREDRGEKLLKLVDFRLIIRLLKVRSGDAIYSPLNIPTDVNLIVGEKRFPVSSAHLSACSPVFASMFRSEFKERNAREVEIKDVPSPEAFGEFLRALLPLNFALPNPKNLLEVAELADRYQVSPLLSNYERLLINCVECPLIDRLLFADRHRLKYSKANIWNSMGLKALKMFYSDNKAVFDAQNDLLIEIVDQISTKSTNSKLMDPEQHVFN